MTELLAGTDEGVFVLHSEGDSPRRLEGPPDAPFLAVTPRARYALTYAGALWRSEGGDWRLVDERAVPDQIWSFAADPRLEGRLYIGVSPALLYRSDDGGESWTACESVRRIPGYERWTFPPPPHIPHVRSIAADPQVAGGVYIGVEEGGVYRSVDGGESWQSLNEGLYWDVHTVTPSGDGQRLYATTGGGFYRSEDGGSTWERLMDGLRRSYTVSFAVSPRTAARVFVAAAASPPPGWVRGANAGLYRSDDGGDHWDALTRGLPERFDTMVSALVADGAGAVFAASAGSVYAGSDEGERWSVVAEGLPATRALALA